MVLPCPGGPGLLVLADTLVVKRGDREEKESAVEEGCLGNQERQGQSCGLMNGVSSQSV